MGRHRAGRSGERTTRPRYRRITAAGSAALVTLVAVFGAIGFIPAASSPEAVSAEVASATSAPKQQASPARSGQAGAVRLSGFVAASPPSATQQPAPVSTEPPSPSGRVVSTGLPSRSGVGKRVVFDISDQRVWLVSAEDEVARTYLVSGSLTDNLAAGTYEVYSTSMDAVGVDDSGRMRHMVRFAHGTQAAIGFHDIPIHRGELVQTRDQLGTPQSHGCIRQLRRDAKALWDFAPTGTQVVVLD